MIVCVTEAGSVLSVLGQRNLMEVFLNLMFFMSYLLIGWRGMNVVD